MNIKAIWAENWKSFGERTNIPLSPIILLIGPNNAGKSNILEILLALKEFSTSNPQGWMTDQIFERFLRRGTDRASFGVDFVIGSQDGSYSVELSQSSSKQPGYVERFTTSGFSFTNTNSTLVSQSGTFSVASSGLAYVARERPNDAGLLYQVLRSYDIWRARPDMIDAPSAVQKGVRLQPHGGNAAALLDHIRDRYPDAYQKLQTDLRRCAPELDRVVAEASENQGMKEIYFHQRDGMVIRCRFATEGLKFLLFVLLILYSPERPQVMAFEEIEHGIHPRRVKDLVGFLRQLAAADGGRQLLLTSHSPLVVDQFRDAPEQVLVVERDPGGTTKVSALPEILKTIPSESGDAALGDLWYSGVLGGVPNT